MASDGTLKFDTSIDASGFETGISKISSIASTGIKATAAILTGAATAIGAIGIAATKTGTEFEGEMSKVAAISGASGDALDSLTAKAKEMGSKTKFSATESAQAFEYMAMAGWKTEDMLGGIEGIMNLAAASGEDLATTSDIVTDALTAFGLSASDSTHFADVLAKASSNANTNVGMMGETFKYVAPVAGALGFSAEDCATAIGLMANSGIKASQAGTSLRSIMSRMAKPTDEVQGAMDALGVSLTDSSGNMKSLDEIMKDLRKGFSKLTEAEKAEMAASLGGQEAMSGLLAIVNASDDDFNGLSDAIYNCDGAAAKMAETMNDNLQGQITILKSGLEGLGISIYENMEAPMKGIVKQAQVMVNDLQKALDSGGLKGLSKEAGKILADVVTEIASAAPDFIQAALDLCNSFIDSIMENSDEFAQAGADLIASLVTALIELSGNLWTSGIVLFRKLLEGLAGNAEEIGKTAATTISQLASAFIENLPLIIQAGKDIMSGFCDGMSEEFPGISALLSGFFDGFASTLGTAISGVVDVLSGIFETLDSADPDTLEAVGKAIGTIAASIALLKVAKTVTSGVSSLLSVLSSFKGGITGLVGIIGKVVEGFSLWAGGAGTFGEVIALQFPKIAAFGAKIGSMATTVAGVFTKIASFASTAFSAIGNFFATFGTTIAGVGAIIGGAIMAVTNFVDMFKNGFNIIKDILMGIGIAIAAIGTVILGAPAAVAAAVAGIVYAVANLVILIKEHWNEIIAFFQGLPEKIGGVVDSIVAWFQQLPGRIFTWLQNVIDNIVQWGSDLYTNITTFVSNAISAVGEWFSQLPGRIGYFLGCAIGEVIKFGLSVISWVTTELPKIIQSVVDWFAQLPGRIWTWLVNVVNNIIAWGQNMYTTITTAATNAVNSVINWFAQLPGRIWTWLVNTINNITQWGINLYNTATTAATNAINSIVSWFQGLPGKIWTWLVNTVTKVGQWAVNLKQKGIEAAQALVTAVVDGVASLPDKMMEVGKNIVDGVWRGICNAKDAFVKNVKDFFGGIVDGIKDTLGIKSPSRVMAKQVGRWIPPGVGKGIEQEMPELYDQVDQEMASLADRMQTAVDVETGNITVKSKATAEHKASTEVPHGGDTYVEEKFEQNNTYNTPVASPSEVSKAQREAARKLLGGVK